MQCYIETSTNNDGNEKGATCLPVCLKDGCVCVCGGGGGGGRGDLNIMSLSTFI